MATPTFTLEVAFATANPLTASPTYTDVSTDLIEISLSRGRQRELDRCDSGQATITVDNSLWQWVPGYASGAHYPNVLPGKFIRFSVTVSGTTYRLFTGYINRVMVDWSDPSLSTATIEATDAFALFTNLPVVASWPNATTGNRIAAVLKSAGWPAANTNIAAGTKPCPQLTVVTTDQQTTLNVINQTADSEPGTLYVDGAGVVQYAAGFTNGSLSATLGDNSGGGSGEVEYDQATLTAPDDTLANYLAFTYNLAPGPTIVQDSSSKTEFGPRQLQKSTYNVNATDTTAVANSFLARYKNPTQIFDPLQIMPSGDLNNAFATCCLCEIGKSVTVKRTPPAASGLPRFSQSCVINWLQHQIKAGANGGEWTTSLRLSGASLS